MRTLARIIDTLSPEERLSLHALDHTVRTMLLADIRSEWAPADIKTRWAEMREAQAIEQRKANADYEARVEFVKHRRKSTAWRKRQETKRKVRRAA